MTRVTQARLALFAVGIIVWGYGYAGRDSTIRWIGIGFLLVSLVLRFLPKHPPREEPPTV